MKAIQKIKFLVFITLVALFADNCTKDDSTKTKSATLAVNFSTISSNSITKSAYDINSGFELISLKISIVDLIIEENTGNDVQQEGDFNNEDNDKGNETGADTETEMDDIVLSGPYVIEVMDGTANIGDIDVYPGTFKKVDFIFLVNSGLEFSGSSLVLNGNFTNSNGQVIPVILKSDFDQQVQLPLAGNGVSVAANSRINLSIILDAQKWMEGLDIASANLSDGEILIDKNNNQNLLTLFNEILTSQIEVED